MNHKELVNAAYKWLLSIGCSFAFKELRTYANEQPDAIGWKNGKSILVECKTSRADFDADSKKYFRQWSDMGVGNYRFFMSSEHIIKTTDLKRCDKRWGLIWLAKNGKFKRVHAPKGNVWGDEWKFKKDSQQEILMLCSAHRRVHKNGDLEKIFNGK